MKSCKHSLQSLLISFILLLLVVGVSGCGGGGSQLKAPSTSTADTNGGGGTTGPQAAPSATAQDQPTGTATPDTTAWKASVDQNGVAHLQVSKSGGKYEEVVVKGVCYSPAPIGYDVNSSLDIGDLFWESPRPDWFNDWSKVWQRDLDNMRKLGINCIHVYNLADYHLALKDGKTVVPDPSTIPDENNGRFVFTHKKFLDACWNKGDRPIYVIVGLGTHGVEWHKETYDDSKNNADLATTLKFWDANIDVTSKEVGSHPAVLGYAMFNELGDPSHVYDNADYATYFWTQVQKHAKTLHDNSPGKLVSWANNDFPDLPTKAKSYLEKYGAGLDFFGVNSYQTARASISLDTYKRENLGDLARPVIATEFGFPNTGHSDTSTYQPYKNDPPAPKRIPPGTDRTQIWVTLQNTLSIFEDDNTRSKTAEVVKNVMPQFYQHPICVGITYFEWSDEWWKERAKVPFLVPDTSSQDPNALTEVYDIPVDPKKQKGGVENNGFPNKYADEESFGLYSISLNGRNADHVFDWKDAGNTNPDNLTARQGLLDTVLGVYAKAEALRAK